MIGLFAALFGPHRIRDDYGDDSHDEVVSVSGAEDDEVLVSDDSSLDETDVFEPSDPFEPMGMGYGSFDDPFNF